MVLGSCVYDDCNETFMLSLPDTRLPVFAKHKCDGCGREMWTKFSRIDPESWSIDGFNEAYSINKHTKQLVPKKASR